MLYNYENTIRMLAEYRKGLLTAPRDKRLAIIKRINELQEDLSNE